MSLPSDHLTPSRMVSSTFLKLSDQVHSVASHGLPGSAGAMGFIITSGSKIIHRYPSDAPEEEPRNGLWFSVCGPLGMPTLSTVTALPPPGPSSPLEQAATDVTAKAAARTANIWRLTRIVSPLKGRD